MMRIDLAFDVGGTNTKYAALCEVWKGAASDVEDALFIVIGTGIGGAISSRSDLIEKIKEKLELIKMGIKRGVDEVNPSIVTCAYEGDANLLGAVYHYKLQRKI